MLSLRLSICLFFPSLFSAKFAAAFSRTLSNLFSRCCCALWQYSSGGQSVLLWSKCCYSYLFRGASATPPSPPSNFLLSVLYPRLAVTANIAFSSLYSYMFSLYNRSIQVYLSVFSIFIEKNSKQAKSYVNV